MTAGRFHAALVAQARAAVRPDVDEVRRAAAADIGAVRERAAAVADRVADLSQVTHDQRQTAAEQQRRSALNTTVVDAVVALVPLLGVMADDLDAAGSPAAPHVRKIAAALAKAAPPAPAPGGGTPPAAGGGGAAPAGGTRPAPG